VEVIGLFIVSAGLAWWLGRRSQVNRVKGLLGEIGDEAQVTLAVARREAEQRNHALAPLHLLYGLLQDDTFIGAIAVLGGDPAKLESRVLDELDRLVQEPGLAYRESAENATFAIVMARVYARYHARSATCADLWHAIARTQTASLVEEVTGIPRVSLAFHLVHGTDQPRSTLVGETAVAIVMKNDDYTTAEFVVAILRDVFELTPDAANQVMLAVHHEGHGIVGRFESAIAKTKVEAAWARARAEEHPLWIGVEVSAI